MALLKKKKKIRYRLQVDVTDGTTYIVVVLFDETVERLVKRPAKALLAEQLEVQVGHFMQNNGWAMETIDKDSTKLPGEVRGFRIKKME